MSRGYRRNRINRIERRIGHWYVNAADCDVTKRRRKFTVEFSAAENFRRLFRARKMTKNSFRIGGDCIGDESSRGADGSRNVRNGS